LDAGAAAEVDNVRRATTLLRAATLLHGPRMLWAKTALLVLVFAPSAPAAAQQPQRDTLASEQHALVLGGGGARGIAHAGAIAALEDLGYTVPVVVGTSMGAIIGALYAAGYSADEIRRVTAEEHWIARFVSDPVPVGPTRMPLRPLLDLGLGRPVQQDGFLTAHGVSLRLVELLFDAGVRARNDFDQLPRRYRAVATDLATGREAVLGDWDLPRAVRASMAVPGAFAPVPWRGRALADGGIANNLPVSVARSLTDLPVIAIDVLQPPVELEERGPLDVGIRALRLLIANARPDAAAEADFLVLPALAAGFSEMWFPRDPSGLLAKGYAAVVEQLPPRGDAAGTRPDGMSVVAGAAPRTIASVGVSGGDAALDSFVARIAAPLAGEYNAQRTIETTRRLYATHLFHAVWPRLEFPDGDDAPAVLVFDVTPTPRTGVAFAARWDNDVGPGAWALLRQRFSLDRPIELRGGGTHDELTRRASMDASIFSTALPGMIWNIGAHAGVDRVRAPAGLHAVHRHGGWAGAELQGKWFVAAFARADHVRDDDEETARSGRTAGPFVRITRAPDPDRVTGVLPEVEAEIRGGDIAYRRMHVGMSTTFTIGRVLAAPLVDLGWSSAAAPRDALFAATRELAPWLRTGSHIARLRAALGVDVAYPIILNGYARVRARTFANAAAPRDIDAERWLAGAELGAAWPTVIGTVEAGVAKGGGGEWRINLGVGPALR
jgi:predicted acylesterase/phospholipase RssA